MIEYRFLQPDEFHLIDHYFDQENVARLDPEWSKVAAAIDLDTNQIIGIMCLQMVPHLEPIIVDPAYRGRGLWEPMAQLMDGYCNVLQIPGAYTQPTHAKAEAMATAMGFERRNHPLYVKLYTPNFLQLIPEGLEGD